MSESLPFERVSIEDAKKVLDDPHAAPVARKVEEQDWRWARTYKPPLPLHDKTISWMARLPPEVRPTELALAYARIANRLCELWANADECDRYFDDLTVDRRG